ncbi:MAG: hypothetical protein ABIY46_05040, partial [Gemmatimonadales bacterium]
DLKTALGGIREARGCLELLGRLEGELQDAPAVNVTVSPEWGIMREIIVGALESYPDAKRAVAQALLTHAGG